MKNIILSISLVLFSISMQAQKRFTLTFTDSIVNIVEQAGAEQSLILNLDSYYFIKRSPSNYYFVSGNYSKMLPYNQIDSVLFASTPWVITSDSALNDTIIGYLSSVHSGGGGGSTDTTSLSNRINLKLDKSDTTNYLGLNRTSNTIVGGIKFGSATGTGRINLPDAGTTSADGIQFGTTSQLFRSDANGSLRYNVGSSASHSFRINNSIRFQVGDVIDCPTPLILYPATLTGSSATSALSIIQTGNTTGSPDVVSINFINTASGAATNLINAKVDGVSRFRVDKNGNLFVPSYISTPLIFSTNIGIGFAGGTTGIYLNSVGSTLFSATGATNNNASAQLEIQSTTKGFLPPRMTATQASAISSPAEGLMLYVTDTNGTFTAKGWWGFNGATWEKLNN